MPDLELEVVGETRQPLLDYLDALVTCKTGILRRSDERAGGVYQIKLKGCVDAMKENLILSMVNETCGSPSCRIWRLLKEKRKLDEKQITKLALMHEKNVRELLYSMFKIGLVFIQVKS